MLIRVDIGIGDRRGSAWHNMARWQRAAWVAPTAYLKPGDFLLIGPFDGQIQEVMWFARDREHTPITFAAAVGIGIWPRKDFPDEIMRRAKFLPFGAEDRWPFEPMMPAVTNTD